MYAITEMDIGLIYLVSTPIRTRRARARARTHETWVWGARRQKIFWYRGAVLRIAASGVRFRPRERLVVPPAVSDYEADDERNRGDHNGGDQEKAEQHAPTCEGHDVSFRARKPVGKDCSV